MKHLLLFACFAVLFILPSCKKKWTKPTDVSFKFQLNSNSNSGLVKFTNVYLVLSKISFKGERKQSPTEVELDQRFSNNMPINFSANAVSSTIKFDIPQGTYTKIEIRYETNTDQNGTSLQINGTYLDSLSNTIAVQFIFPAGDAITLSAKNSSGGNEIVLVEGHPVTPTISMNPNYWFASIPKSMLDGATQDIVNSVPTILIDKDNNHDIYNLILDRIKDGNQCVFN